MYHLGLLVGYIIAQILLLVFARDNLDLYYISLTASILCLLYVIFIHRSGIVSNIDNVNNAAYGAVKNAIVIPHETIKDARKINPRTKKVMIDTMNRIRNPFGSMSMSSTNTNSTNTNSTKTRKTMPLGTYWKRKGKYFLWEAKDVQDTVARINKEDFEDIRADKHAQALSNLGISPEQFATGLETMETYD